MSEPGLPIRFLSVSHPAETWIDVWAYFTIPNLPEVIVVRSDVVGAPLLRRNADGSWPPVSLAIDREDVTLDSIGFRTPLPALYAGTWLADAEAG